MVKAPENVLFSVLKTDELEEREEAIEGFRKAFGQESKRFYIRANVTVSVLCMCVTLIHPLYDGRERKRGSIV